MEGGGDVHGILPGVGCCKLRTEKKVVRFEELSIPVEVL
jgi:hypothetical protein